MSPDPAGQYANPYSYVGGDPSNSIDPDGRYSWTRFWRDAEGVAATAAWNVVGGLECGATAGSNCDFGYVWVEDDGDVSHSGWYGVHGFSPGGVVNPKEAGFFYSGQYHANDNMKGLGKHIVVEGTPLNTGEGFSFGVTANPGTVLQDMGNNSKREAIDDANESMQNGLLGLGYRDNEEFNGSGGTPRSVQKGRKIMTSQGAQWVKSGTLPKAIDPNGDWCDKYKCNKFLQETAGVPRGKTINQLAGDNSRQIPGNRAGPGDVYLLPASGDANGHGMLLGNDASFIHASNTLGGVVETTGWDRVFYRWFYHSDKETVVHDY